MNMGEVFIVQMGLHNMQCILSCNNSVLHPTVLVMDLQNRCSLSGSSPNFNSKRPVAVSFHFALFSFRFIRFVFVCVSFRFVLFSFHFVSFRFRFVSFRFFEFEF